MILILRFALPFLQVFNCIPCDSATTFSAVKRIREQNSLAKMVPEKAKELLKDLQVIRIFTTISFPQLSLKEDDVETEDVKKTALSLNSDYSIFLNQSDCCYFIVYYSTTFPFSIAGNVLCIPSAFIPHKK